MLIVQAQSDEVGFRSGDLPQPITQTEHPEHSGVDAETYAWLAALDAQQRRPTDVGALGDHDGGEPASASGALKVAAELGKSMPHGEGE